MRAFALVTVLAAAPATAQRIGVINFTGPNAANVRNQLVTALCDKADCVSSTKVTTNNKPDWKKAKKEALQFFVLGTVGKKGRKQVVTIEVLSKPGASALKKSFPIGADGLSSKALSQAVDAVKGAFGGAGTVEEDAEEETPVVPPKAVERTPEPKPEPKTDERPARAEVKKDTREAPRSSDTSDDEGRDAAPTTRRLPFIAVEVFGDFLNRSFGYVEPVTNLRRYGLPIFPMAGGKLEFYPLALVTQGALGGLGLEGSASFAPWLRSRRENTADVFYPTSTLRIDAGLAWRIMPVQSLNLSLIPLVGIRLHSFVVQPGSDMTRLDALPNLNYFGIRAGAGFEIGLVDDLLLLFGRFQAIPVLSSGEIISDAFFPRGSNFGLDGSIGVGVSLVKVLQLRAAFQFTRYGLVFRSEMTDPAIAQGATDQYLGGTVAVRFQY
jgi:hypothetical protein